MPAVLTRRSIVCAAAVGAGAIVARPLGVLAQGAELKPGKDVYPIAVPIYMSHYIAATQNFFRDEGYDFQLIQGGNGVKTREIVASGQGDFGIGDITHCLQLINRGRPARVLAPVDTRSSSVKFIIRKDLFDSGIDTIEKAAEWKRPDGRKPIFGVSSIGGTAHLWANYYTELLGIDQNFTWVGLGEVETLLGAIKTRQADVLSLAVSMVHDAESHGWAKLIFDGSAPEMWNKVIGGPVPVTAHFTLQSTIEKDAPKVQAFTNAIHRAHQFVRTRTPDEIFAAIEPYVGSTSRDANIREITANQAVTDFDGIITQESYDRGGKVWFREFTGIKPVPLPAAVADRFIRAARQRYPA
jgi:NitT/TauT family transport system substrate-binding protein